MSQLHAVNFERHGARSWRKPSGFAHAAGDAVAALGTQEMMQAVPHAALAFAMVQDRYLAVMVQGLEPGCNLLLAANNHWMGGHVPLGYQIYPFQLARNEAGDWLVCVDEASGLVDDAAGGEAFFTPDKQMSPALAEITQKLTQYEGDKEHNRAACAVMAQYELFEPWRLVINSVDGDPAQEVNGLYRINEPALNALSAEALLALRNAGAIAVAYAQLFSMQNIHRLAELHVKRITQQRLQAAKPANLRQSDLISFDNLA
jgi:hypothetical protein